MTARASRAQKDASRAQKDASRAQKDASRAQKGARPPTACAGPPATAANYYPSPLRVYAIMCVPVLIVLAFRYVSASEAFVGTFTGTVVEELHWEHRRVAIALLVLTMCITIAGAWTTGAVTLMTFLIRKKSS